MASVLLSCLPMLGDYFTNDLLSASPGTSMVGNLINETVLTPGQTGYAGAFVMLVLVVSLLPMFYYVRSVSAAERHHFLCSAQCGIFPNETIGVATPAMSVG